MTDRQNIIAIVAAALTRTGREANTVTVAEVLDGRPHLIESAERLDWTRLVAAVKREMATYTSQEG